ncbi:nucleotidyltransferase family protein [Arundinibacter roseus]|uniref:Nucleotidyltransferase family protein n=1 Tax=Arundinibacter roseus TaxID=2070510 RepID=A0A4R4K3D1_9BACT|nr:nucleotidyltransferase family protein [Arundinibacter roseus]TDB61848.1 nucleotidyltransferase family protein [Arundinibacter roseus]
MALGIVILAAGESSRMGKPKQILPLESGKSLLQHTVETALATSLRPVVVVVGANKAEVVPELKNLPITIVDNAFWKEGMSTSVRIGLAGLYMTESNLSGALILVCDQPYITAGLLTQMVAVWEETGKKAVACRYKEQWGVPVLVGRELLPELLALSGDQGAKPVLKKYLDDVAFVNFDEGIIDLDTPEEYQTYQGKVEE